MSATNKQVFYYTEPQLKDKKWRVNKVVCETKKVLESFSFHSEKFAFDFLKGINIYVDGVLCYSSNKVSFPKTIN